MKKMLMTLVLVAGLMGGEKIQCTFNMLLNYNKLNGQTSEIEIPKKYQFTMNLNVSDDREKIVADEGAEFDFVAKMSVYDLPKLNWYVKKNSFPEQNIGFNDDYTKAIIIRETSREIDVYLADCFKR